MKPCFNRNFLLIGLLSFLFFSCQHRQFGHLSKVRVKQKGNLLQPKAKPISTEPSFEFQDEPEPVIEASAGTPLVRVEPNNRSMARPKMEQDKPRFRKELANPVKKKKIRRDPEPEPVAPNLPPNIPGILSVVFGALSAFSLGMVFFSYDYFEYFFYASLIASFLGLILGVVGIVVDENGKTKNGLWVSIAGLVLSSSIILLVLTFLFFLFLFSGGMLFS